MLICDRCKEYNNGMTYKTKPVLALTPGDPAGVGLDLVLKLAHLSLDCQLAVIADPDLLVARAHELGVNVALVPFQGQAHEPGCLTYIQPSVSARPAKPGVLDVANGAYVLDTIRMAAEGCLAGAYDAMVTGPVHKGIINESGHPFSGHTEFIAEICQAPQPVMMLASDTLRVALATTHLPLREVADAITPARLTSIIDVLNRDLKQKMGIVQPVILVCGLNPHAGEDGHMGREEIEVISPTLRKLRDQGLQLIGPIAADTAFTPISLERVDAVLAMYHDQGLTVIKAQGFGKIVNITLGLPIIRTSVDHGTALGLAATGKASEASLLKAIEQAITMTRVSQQ